MQFVQRLSILLSLVLLYLTVLQLPNVSYFRNVETSRKLLKEETMKRINLQKIKTKKKLKEIQESINKRYFRNNITVDTHINKLKPDERVNYSVCKNVVRPEKSDINLYKNVYQYVSFKVRRFPDSTIYIMNFYMDDRFIQEEKTRFIRGIVSIKAPDYGNITANRFYYKWKRHILNRAKINALIWYENMKDPVSTKCYFMGAAGLTRNVENTFYFQFMIVCPVPNIKLLPYSVTITQGNCTVENNNIQIVFPNAPRYLHSERSDIGVCTASLYGRLSRNNIPYFVSWMETLSIFGVTEISLNNASLIFEDDDIKNTFQHYQNIGRLVFTHYPVIHDVGNESNERLVDAATEAINKLTTGDCIYRNMKRYWWTLIIDLDELPVPKIGKTYKESIDYFIKQYPVFKEAHCLSMRSLLFPRNLDAIGNDEFPDHLPYLRFTNRLPKEFITSRRKSGKLNEELFKSFHNPRNVVSSGHHFCVYTHKNNPRSIKKGYLTEDIIVLHHYRKKCKFRQDCRNEVIENIVHDDYLVKFFDQQIIKRTERALGKVGFLIDQK